MTAKYCMDSLSEEGYFSSSNANTTFNVNHDSIHSSPRELEDLYSKFDFSSNVFMNDSAHSSVFDSFTPRNGNKGILFDRIKEAQDTIDSLSSKLCFCEKEIASLNQRKQAFENACYRLQNENEQLKNDQSIKEQLRMKVDSLAEEVSELLRSHQDLVMKHNEQEKSLAVTKLQKALIEEENANVKRLNESLIEKVKSEEKTIELTKKTENEISNKLLILNIEKDALTSEFDRMVNLFHNEEEKSTNLEHQNEMLETQIKSISDSNKKFLGQATALNEANQSLKEELKQTMKKQTNCEKELTAELMSLKAQNKLIVSNNLELSNALNSLKDENSQLSLQIVDLNKKFNNTIAEMTALESQCAEHITNNSNLDSDIQKLREEVNKLSLEKAIMMQKVFCAETEKSNCERRLRKIKQKANENSRSFENQITELRNASVSMKDDYSIEKQRIIAEKDSRISELKNANEKFKEEVEHMYFLFNEEKQKCGELDQNLCSAQTELESMKSDLLNLTAKITQLQEQNQMLEICNEKCKNENTQYCEKLDELKLKYGELADASEQNAVKSSSLENTVLALKNENEELSKLNKKNAELLDLLNRQSKSELLNERTSYQRKTSSLQLLLDQVNASVTQAKQEKEQLEKEFEKTISELKSEHEIELKQVTDDNMSFQMQCKKLQLKHSTFKSEISQNDMKLEQLNRMYKQQEDLLSCKQRELDECLERLKEFSLVQKDSPAHKDNIEYLNVKIAELEKEKNELLEESQDNRIHVNELLERLNTAIQEIEKYRCELSDEKKKGVLKEQKLKKDLYELSTKNERLLSELRQKNKLKQSASGEIDTLRLDHSNLKKELEVLAELNKKLEVVNESVQQENCHLRRVNEQLQMDIQTLKSSFEDLLAKELEKQRSEYLEKENELLRKFSKVG